MLIIERHITRSREPLAPGKHKIEVDTTSTHPGGPAEVVIKVDGKEDVGSTVKRTVPAAFTASGSFDVGTDLGSPVSLEYFDRKPFAYDGQIEHVTVELKPQAAVDRALR